MQSKYSFMAGAAQTKSGHEPRQSWEPETAAVLQPYWEDGQVLFLGCEGCVKGLKDLKQVGGVGQGLTRAWDQRYLKIDSSLY